MQSFVLDVTGTLVAGRLVDAARAAILRHTRIRAQRPGADPAARRVIHNGFYSFWRNPVFDPVFNCLNRIEYIRRSVWGLPAMAGS